ncbi:uncharacterized protein L3040_000946 [Drepanopeziza brunnea f. sp. 'multigermtubi']|uniref:uncharacterized protein n=1 Tax=Drepanopeziza brunnea f. sp. 'multigermtubi' TaxID=698441 RepID=UPI0023886DEE|nr:hypothetical protein L3040_000946 [Drepanopeziza brunnea f. sp. 'multigermtubi']
MYNWITKNFFLEKRLGASYRTLPGGRSHAFVAFSGHLVVPLGFVNLTWYEADGAGRTTYKTQSFYDLAHPTSPGGTGAVVLRSQAPRRATSGANKTGTSTFARPYQTAPREGAAAESGQGLSPKNRPEPGDFYENRAFNTEATTQRLQRIGSQLGYQQELLPTSEATRKAWARGRPGASGTATVKTKVPGLARPPHPNQEASANTKC